MRLLFRSMLVSPSAIRRFAACVAVSIILPATSAMAEPSSIVVGQVVDQSGADVESTRDYVIGAKLYFDFVNSTGGINGVRIRQVVKDAGGDPAQAQRMTQELLDQDGADVLFGFVGESAIHAVQSSGILQRSNVALVSPLSGLIDPTSAREQNVFVSRASYGVELRKVVEHFKAVAVSRFAVVSTRSDLSEALMPEIKSDLQQGGMQLVASAESKTPSDLTAAVKRISDSGAQVLVVLGDGVDVGIIAKQLAERRTGIFAVGLSLANYRVVVQIAGNTDATGILLSQVVPNPLRADTPLTREHLAFMKKYLDEPPSNLTLEGFMAAKGLVDVLRESARHGRVDRAAVLRTVRVTAPKDVGGVTIAYTQSPSQIAAVELTMLRANGTLLY